MEFKRQYLNIYFLQIMITAAVTSQPPPPPPPNIPTTDQPVNLDSALPKTTPSIVPLGSSGSDVTQLPLCPDLICTLEFIPDHCRITQVLERNGVKCTGCAQWKDSCKKLPKETNDILPPTVKCPNLTCTENIPLKCVEVETYEYMGITCEKCPIYRNGCVPDALPSNENMKCPVQACTLQFIPEECREIPTFQHKGLTCKGCPIWRQGCEKGVLKKDVPQDSTLPRVSCPFMVCDNYIPKECRVQVHFQHRGRTCTKCPEWRQGCREKERLYVFNLSGNQLEQTDDPCPKFPCMDNSIPAECKIEQPYDFRGRTCYKCPLRSSACATSFPGRVAPMLPPCPLIKCERRSDIPPNCYKREFYNRGGKVCEKCPSIIPECLQVAPVKPNVLISPNMFGGQELLEKPCPLLRCQEMFISPECIEIPVYQHEGKMCQGCPRQREGCVPSPGDQLATIADKEFPIIPGRGPQTTCPIKACPMIHIPPECKEEQPYQYLGKTCYDCPRQKENCVTINSKSLQQPDNTQQMSCPMFGCPYILIPPECRVERPFQYQGKTCYMCPQWREGCVPFPPKPNVNNIPAEPLTTTTESNIRPEQSIPETEKSCPLMACTRILIPPQCREEQPYEYNGKTCYKCPKWRDGCLGRRNKVETPTTPPPPIDTSILLKQSNSPSISDLKEIIPVRNIINTVNAVTCPPLRCPEMFIPIQCREQSVYQYEGRSCQGCPTWRLGCNSGSPMNMNANGILSFSLFNELLALKKR